MRTFPAAHDDCPGVTDVGNQEHLLAVILQRNAGRQHTARHLQPGALQKAELYRTMYVMAQTAVDPHCGPPRPREPIPCRLHQSKRQGVARSCRSQSCKLATPM